MAIRITKREKEYHINTESLEWFPETPDQIPNGSEKTHLTIVACSESLVAWLQQLNNEKKTIAFILSEGVKAHFVLNNSCIFFNQYVACLNFNTAITNLTSGVSFLAECQ